MNCKDPIGWIFKIYDTENSGFLNKDDVKKVLNEKLEELGQDCTYDDLFDDFFAGYDQEGSGKLNKD